MRARAQLTILDHNSNTGRKQKLDSSGKRHTIVAYQKQSKSFVLRNVYEDKSYQFRDDLVERVQARRRDEMVDCRDPSSRLPTKDLPKHVAPVEKPDKAMLLHQARLRFSK
ncbi:hypothetical protein SKAU_G00397030 [Synaphobranchus kaupii]|uniref:Uncharacterized protein n=1 Tax=Synaphobranchus kaupii TaxID=118154 RepID=A0A9Q1IBY9_SYNKA|nr:hypothetical protein SKAU_G00397030 [Synaphobranchus kaupii]